MVNASVMTNGQLADCWRQMCARYPMVKAEGGQATELLEDAEPIVAEILKRNIATFRVRDAKPASLELLCLVLERIVKGGVYIANPHGEMIHRGEKTSILKGRSFDRLRQFHILVAGRMAYGFVRFGMPDLIRAKDVAAGFNRHRVSEEDRMNWWPHKEYLYEYPIREFVPFEKPRGVNHAQGAQVFIEQVEFAKASREIEKSWDTNWHEMIPTNGEGEFVFEPDGDAKGTLHCTYSDGKELALAVSLGTVDEVNICRSDAGQYELGVVREHCIEIFLHGKVLTGRYILKYVQSVGSEKRIWLISKPDSQIPLAKSHDLSEVIAELQSKHEKHLVWACPGEMPKLIDVASHNAENFEKSWEIPILKAEQRLVYGIVLEPEVEDGQGDIYDAGAIERAAHAFMECYQELDVQHAYDPGGLEVVESYIAPVDFELNGQAVRRGSWLMAVKVWNDEVWEKIKRGELTGFSVKGIAHACYES